ncbi:hypothetical protein BABINDRAFT_9374 [Babjeviella inositovora NRRL Y-12698]|uniref:PCI domain-containing protein n=1 Tax=Babjeviella inositovora NRRL Y-12698 TaxID=984486 RepID=A0A1E3QMC7_9ASCO|nr:uncharacterized protein BABINDRAFT_9374 [Babjeviella inositovora NRRL Y-12698]ODQ78614.1 hypothetical protein BABINDRAFT_9374 [Babjeviella inositovora NRRL Y-12698]
MTFNLDTYLDAFSGPFVIERLHHIFLRSQSHNTRVQAATTALHMMQEYSSVAPFAKDLVEYVTQSSPQVLSETLLRDLYRSFDVESLRLLLEIEVYVEKAPLGAPDSAAEDAEEAAIRATIEKLAVMQAIAHETLQASNTLVSAGHLPHADMSTHRHIEAHWLCLMFEPKNVPYLISTHLKRNDIHRNLATASEAETDAFYRVKWYTLLGNFLEKNYDVVVSEFTALVLDPKLLLVLFSVNFNQLVNVPTMVIIVFLSLYLVSSTREFTDAFFGTSEDVDPKERSAVSGALEELVDHTPPVFRRFVDELLTTNSYARLNDLMGSSDFKDVVDTDLFLSSNWDQIKTIVLQKQILGYLSAVRSVNVGHLAKKLGVAPLDVREAVSDLVVVLDLRFKYNPLDDSYVLYEEEAESDNGQAMDHLLFSLDVATTSSVVSNFVVRNFVE